VPQVYAPGEAYQFDWSHEIVILHGGTTEVKVAQMRLSHSRMSFIRAYRVKLRRCCSTRTDKAFAFYRGACERGIYDNMKTAVDAIFVGKERLFNRRFLQMMSHYLVEPTPCTPGAAWEKGQNREPGEEPAQGFVRATAALQIVRGPQRVADGSVCGAHQEAAAPRVPDKTIFEVFEREREQLIPYRALLMPTGRRRRRCRSSAWFGRQQQVLGDVDGGWPHGRRLRLCRSHRHQAQRDNRRGAIHARSQRDHVEYNACHYLDVLTKKPGALRNGAPFMDLPGALGRVQRKLRTMKDGGRQMVAILTSVESDGLSAVEAACAEALGSGACSAE